MPAENKTIQDRKSLRKSEAKNLIYLEQLTWPMML